MQLGSGNGGIHLTIPLILFSLLPYDQFHPDLTLSVFSDSFTYISHS